jgi:hypothetical protein
MFRISESKSELLAATHKSVQAEQVSGYISELEVPGFISPIRSVTFYIGLCSVYTGFFRLCLPTGDCPRLEISQGRRRSSELLEILATPMDQNRAAILAA